MKNPVVETDEAKHNGETVEGIAKNIAALARSVHALLDGQLKRKAIVVLLANSAGMGQGTVEAVLNALADLEKDWLNK